MNVQIPEEQQAIVEALVAAGRFASVDEAISEGIRLLASTEELRQQIPAQHVMSFRFPSGAQVQEFRDMADLLYLTRRVTGLALRAAPEAIRRYQGTVPPEYHDIREARPFGEKDAYGRWLPEEDAGLTPGTRYPIRSSRLRRGHVVNPTRIDNSAGQRQRLAR